MVSGFTAIDLSAMSDKVASLEPALRISFATVKYPTYPQKPSQLYESAAYSLVEPVVT